MGAGSEKTAPYLGRKGEKAKRRKGILKKPMERKKIENFEDLLVWQKGMEIVRQVYRMTRDGAMGRDFSFRDQLRRAALSIPTNIAEGFERASRKEYVNFLNFAKGSAGEVRSLLHVALELDYLKQDEYRNLIGSVLELSRFLSNQIKSLRVSSR
jgi:four helix bundle protein